jgi:hypothetical protein
MSDLFLLKEEDGSEVNIPTEGNNHKNLTFEEILKNFRESFKCTKEIRQARRSAFQGEWGKP